MSTSKKREKRGNNTFNSCWLSNANYKDWLRRHSSTHAACTLCCTTFSIVNMGESAIKSHAKPNSSDKKPTRHQQRLEEQQKAKESLSVLHFVGSSTNVEEASEEALISSPGTLESYVIPLSVIKAEIRWVMKVVVSAHSYRSCIGLKDLFVSMFPDSQIVKAFTLGKSKCAYFLCYGIAPHFKKILTEEIKNSPFFTLHFDESMNKILQNEQMDACIRYWSDENKQVVARYFDSVFFNRPNATNITNGIDTAIKPLNKNALICLGMDGPSTNHSVFRMVQDNRKEDGFSPLENIGSCGLHVVSGALQTGVIQSSWTLKKVLHAMWKLFHDSPARRDLYMQINESQEFALRFCSTRWTENESVAARAIAVWDNVVAVIKHYVGLCVSKQPKQPNSSYNTLKSNYTDKLMPLKFQVFKDMAHKFNRFLIIFQTDAPMVPFLADCLSTLFRGVMGYLVKRSVLDEALTALQLIRIDVTKSENLLPVNNLRLSTASKGVLKEAKCTSAQKEAFLKEYKAFLVGIITKLQERSPLSSSVVRNASALNPVNMANEEKACILKFRALVDKLYENRRLSDIHCDEAKSQFEDFLQLVVRPNRNIFAEFDYRTTRLDEFLAVYAAGSEKYKHMWKVMIFVFVLSHGQASIERGFNVNKEFLVEHMEELALKSHRLVYDQIKATNKEIHQINISRELVISCKEASSKYKAAQGEKAKDVAETAAGKKRKLKQEEIVQVKRKKVELDKVICSLTKDIEVVSVEASTKETFEEMKLCLEKANLFRDTLKKKKTVAKELGEALQKLQEEELNI